MKRRRNNTIKKSKFQTKYIKFSFTGTKITKYAGLTPIMKYLQKIDLGNKLNELFPTSMYGSTKFTKEFEKTAKLAELESNR